MTDKKDDLPKKVAKKTGDDTPPDATTLYSESEIIADIPTPDQLQEGPQDDSTRLYDPTEEGFDPLKDLSLPEDDELPPVGFPEDETNGPPLPGSAQHQRTLFTSIDTLKQIPTSEDFDENTDQFDENSSIDSADLVDQYEEMTSESTKQSTKLHIPKFEAAAAKHRFGQIKDGFKNYGTRVIQGLRKAGAPGGGGGGGSRNFQLPGFIRNFDWDKFLKTIFAPENRDFHHRAFLISLFLLSSFHLGKIIGNFLSVTPSKNALGSSRSLQKSLTTRQESYDAISKSNLFNTPTHKPLNNLDKKEVDPNKSEKIKNIICYAASKETSLPITLKNTTVLQDSVKSIASVQFRGNNELMDMREGDTVENVAKISKIERLKIVIKNLESGECEYVANTDEKEKDPSPLSKSSGNIVSPRAGKKLMEQNKDTSIVNEGNKFKIKKAVRDEMLSNLDQVLTQARAIQIKNPDGSLSFKITEIVPGSIYSKLGMNDGDVVYQINGKPIKTVNELMSLFGQIKNIDHFQLGVKSNGQSINREYDFE